MEQFFLCRIKTCWERENAGKIYRHFPFLPHNISHMSILSPFPKRQILQILDGSKLKEFSDDNTKFDESGRKFSKWVENTVGKGDIAHIEQFLLFPQCFQKTCTAETQKPGFVWERVCVVKGKKKSIFKSL